MGRTGRPNPIHYELAFNVLHHLQVPQLQNMHECIVPARADTDPRVMEALVQRKYPQLPGPPLVPPVQFFSRNLLAYLDSETLVAFSPYYRADDGRMAGKVEAFHLQAVERDKSFKDHQLHHHITRKLTAWCKLYRPKQPSVEQADDEDIDGAEGDIVDVPAGGAVTPKASPCLRMKRRRNLLPLPPLRLLPLPPLPRAAAMARDRLPLVGRSMPE
jgi:hypothetical protein